MRFAFISLYNGHIRNSKKVLVSACIGLILSLTIISSTNIYFDNSKRSLIDDYLTNYSSDSSNAYYSSDIYISFTKNPPYQDGFFSESLNQINELKKEYDLRYIKEIKGLESLKWMFIPVTLKNDSYSQSLQVFELDSVLYTELMQINNKNPLLPGSALPGISTSVPEVFALYFSTKNHEIAPSISLDKDSKTNLTDCLNCKNFTNYYNVKVSGYTSVNVDKFIIGNNSIFDNPTFEKYPHLSSLRSKDTTESEMVLFVASLKDFSTILKPAWSNLPSSYTSFSYEIFISFDYPKIDPFNANSIVAKTRIFDNKIADRFYSVFGNEIAYFSLEFRTQKNFELLNNVLNTIIFNILLVALPIWLISIFFIYYSFNLLNRNILRQIGNYKTRGASSYTIFGFQILDIVLVISISVIIGLISGIPLAALALESDFLLSFNYPIPRTYIVNFQAISSVLIYSAIIITLFTNARRIKRLSTISIVETEQPSEKETPMWQKHYLDLVLLLFGILTYLLLYSFIKNPTLTEGLSSIIDPLLIVMIPSPICLVLGLILGVNRIIPIIIDHIGTSLWKRNGNLTAFAFKNIHRYKQSSIRAIILISIIVGFLVFFYALPFSGLKNFETNFYYQNGAEGLGTFVGGYNVTDIDFIEHNMTKAINSYTPYIVLSSQDKISGNIFIFMLVNLSSYLNSANLNFDLGLSNSLQDDFIQLNHTNRSDERNLPVILDKSTYINSKAFLNQSTTIFALNTSLTLHIVDTFTNWPVLKARYSNYQSLAIADIDYYIQTLKRSIAASTFLRVMDEGIFFNFKENSNQKSIVSAIEGNTTVVFKSLFSEDQQLFKKGILFRTQVGQINNDVIMSTLIALNVIIIYSYIHLDERRKEMSLLKAIGMNAFQIMIVFLIETIILIVCSIIVGLTIGILLTHLLSILLFNPLQSYPPYRIAFPLDIITITIGLLVLISMIFTIMVSIKVSKQETLESFVEN